MRLDWNTKNNTLVCNNRRIPITCLVRTIARGNRKISEVPVLTENQDGTPGKPYDPRPFPRGEWTVLGLLEKEHPYEAPIFISTDAHQSVNVWTVVDGHYGEKTEEVVEDYGYGLHCSTSFNTLGCGKIMFRDDLNYLVEAIRAAWLKKEKVTLLVR